MFILDKILNIFNIYNKMEIEKEYIEKKIKNELINKEFELWDKESINFLLSIYEHKKYNDFYTINLILFNDYINWYKKKVINSVDNPVNSTMPNSDTSTVPNSDTSTMPCINIHSEHFDKMYPLKDLLHIYSLINDDIYHNVHDNYINILNNNSSSHNDLNIQFSYLLNNNLFFIIIGIFFTIFYIILKYILYFFQFRRKEEKKHIFEVKIPIPDNFINNSLIKLFLGDNKDNNSYNLNTIPNFNLDNIKENLFEKLAHIITKII